MPFRGSLAFDMPYHKVYITTEQRSVQGGV